MWAAIIQAAAWLAGTKAGRIVSAIAGGLLGLLLLRKVWKDEGAEEQEAEQAKETVRVQERIEEESASYRADGAVDRLKRGIFVVPLLMGLAACTAPTPVRPVCIQVIRYSPETQAAAAAEMEALAAENHAPTLRRFVEDYGDLRARNRAACQR